MYNHTAEDHFEELLESDQNDPQIPYQIGLCYQNGQGVEQNGVQALQWLRRAAEQILSGELVDGKTQAAILKAAALRGLLGESGR